MERGAPAGGGHRRPLRGRRCGRLRLRRVGDGPVWARHRRRGARLAPPGHHPGDGGPGGGGRRRPRLGARPGGHGVPLQRGQRGDVRLRPERADGGARLGQRRRHPVALQSGPDRRLPPHLGRDATLGGPGRRRGRHGAAGGQHRLRHRPHPGPAGRAAGVRLPVALRLQDRPPVQPAGVQPAGRGRRRRLPQRVRDRSGRDGLPGGPGRPDGAGALAPRRQGHQLHQSGLRRQSGPGLHRRYGRHRQRPGRADGWHPVGVPDRLPRRRPACPLRHAALLRRRERARPPPGHGGGPAGVAATPAPRCAVDLQGRDRAPGNAGGHPADRGRLGLRPGLAADRLRTRPRRGHPHLILHPARPGHGKGHLAAAGEGDRRPRRVHEAFGRPAGRPGPPLSVQALFDSSKVKTPVPAVVFNELTRLRATPVDPVPPRTATPTSPSPARAASSPAG